jgi:hypothetical protein
VKNEKAKKRALWDFENNVELKVSVAISLCFRHCSIERYFSLKSSRLIAEMIKLFQPTVLMEINKVIFVTWANYSFFNLIFT